VQLKDVDIDLKQVAVLVFWKDYGKVRSTEVTRLVANL